MMGTFLSRVKIGLYVLVIILVGTLFATRVYNALQKTTYLTQSIFDDGNVQIQISFPARILSPKNDIAYPITVSFLNRGGATPSHTYEAQLASPTLLFVDAKGGEAVSSFQFDSAQAFVEKTVYVRPYLSNFYPQSHGITAQVLVDGQKSANQTAPITLKTEPQWLSFFSFAAASLLEISIASALVTWIANALDAAWNSRKERISQWKTDLNALMSLPLLEQMSKFREMENSIRWEHLEDELQDDLRNIRNLFSEREFLQAVGDCLQDEMFGRLNDIEKLYEFFQNEKNFKEHKASISALAKILDAAPSLDQAAILPLISSIIKLWDDFDADVRDLIVGALTRLSKKVDLGQLPKDDLKKEIFWNDKRLRLVRFEEIRRLFPQLAPFAALTLDYETVWPHERKCPEQKIPVWLNQHNLIASLFGCDLDHSQRYPKGVTRPNQIEFFEMASPVMASCPRAEDIYPLAVLLRDDCMGPRRVFPILLFLQQEDVSQSPLTTLAHAAGRTWIDILPSSPDVLLDLSFVSQQILLELLCWHVGTKEMLEYILVQQGLKDDETGKVLKHKIADFQPRLSPGYLPEKQVLLSWLRLRPPNVDSAYIILPLAENLSHVVHAWCDTFSPLIPVLLQNGLITKVVAYTRPTPFLSLPEINLEWTDNQLKKSLDSQFDAAMNPQEISMGKSIRFPELFGPGTTEEQTTHKLISASHNSLARMCMLGNRLLQTHCEKHGVSDKYFHLEDLDAILKTA